MSEQCRFCGALLKTTFVDLGVSPMANSLLEADGAGRMEPFYPLHAFVCHDCLLVQVKDFESPQQIFSHYLYFSSYSESWLEHARRYCHLMLKRFKLTPSSTVIEVASNDGYLLRNFVEQGIPVLGIEPAANVAEVAIRAGIPTRVAFFGTKEANAVRADGWSADLMCANNVLAHVPDINDFVEGFRILLKPDGVATFEFPHLLQLIEQNQFDTIYHEHFSYLSLLAVERIFRAHALDIFDVEEIPTHGGSLRLYVCHAGSRLAEKRVAELRAKELSARLDQLDTYAAFPERVIKIKCELLRFCIDVKERGQHLVGYGAPAKGNTLLNYCGIGPEFLSFTVDRSPHKQGLLLPGTHIPIRHPDAIFEAKPDFILILPWNLKDEVIDQMQAAREFGARFVTAVPRLELL